MRVQYPFRLRTEAQGDSLLLQLEGEFDLAVLGQVEAALPDGDGEGRRLVVIDLRDVTFMDSSGLLAVLQANERSKADGFELAVVRPEGNARRVFTITRVGSLLSMVDHPSEIEGLHAEAFELLAPN
jgi:anti-sigma B factor antagonist